MSILPRTASPTRKRRNKTDKLWENKKRHSKLSAKQSAKSEGMWSFYHSNLDKVGNINNIYRCNKVKCREEQSLKVASI